jgi:hypothetical protein
LEKASAKAWGNHRARPETTPGTYPSLRVLIQLLLVSGDRINVAKVQLKAFCLLLTWL